jgi:hypothetical protein
LSTLNAEELYSALLSEGLGAYVAQTSDMESAKQMAQHLAKLCVEECIRLGWVPSSGQNPSFPNLAPEPLGFVGTTADPYAGYVTAENRPAVGALGIPSFAEMIPSHVSGHSSSGPGALLPVGSPFQPVQHYNTSSNRAPQPVLPQALVTEPAAPWHASLPKKPGAGEGASVAQGLEPARPWYPPHLAHLYRSAPLPTGAAPSGPHDVEGEGVISTPAMPRMMSNQTFVPPEGTGAGKR